MKKLLLMPLLLWGHSAVAQTYAITGLSTQDLLVIGAGLDKLPREDGDRNGLYARIQAQITQQATAMAKVRADAEKAALDKAVAEAIEKAKAEKELTQ